MMRGLCTPYDGEDMPVMMRGLCTPGMMERTYCMPVMMRGLIVHQL